jgi:hypothetical protein
MSEQFSEFIVTIAILGIFFLGLMACGKAGIKFSTPDPAKHIATNIVLAIQANKLINQVDYSEPVIRIFTEVRNRLDSVADGTIQPEDIFTGLQGAIPAKYHDIITMAHLAFQANVGQIEVEFSEDAVAWTVMVDKICENVISQLRSLNIKAARPL